MSDELKIEKITKEKLKEQFSKKMGDILYSDYLKTKDNLYINVLEEIKRVLPDHSDHGPRHVQNVIENTQNLLEKHVDKIDGINLYCLLMAILFHDAGNYFDRKDHQKKINEIYCFARPDTNGVSYKMEQRLITEIVKAHCGFAKDKTKNTLKFLDQNSLHDLKVSVKTRELAAVLRFADELAEGSHRTSTFRTQKEDYPDENKIYHRYAEITNIAIDPNLERIALTYNINVNEIKPGPVLKELIDFTFDRIVKLDQERRYTKHYCNWLQDFKQTSVSFNFWEIYHRLELGLGTLTLDDLVIPGDNNKTIDQYNSEYNASNIVEKIISAIGNCQRD